MQPRYLLKFLRLSRNVQKIPNQFQRSFNHLVALSRCYKYLLSAYINDRRLLADCGTKYKNKTLAHRPIIAHFMIALWAASKRFSEPSTTFPALTRLRLTAARQSRASAIGSVARLVALFFAQ
jgi:hypothetical protein